jgi:GH25 family lysozyme M1 (1,4-beta-N-acetylmuramidase)
MLKGLDLNHWRPLKDFSVLVRLQHKFFINKATEGTGFLDGTLYPNIASAKLVGLLTGAYHYLRTSVDPTLQANYYWSKIKDLKLEIPPILDVETYSNDITKLNSYAKIFLERIKVLSGKTPIIYTNQNTWNLIGNPSWSLSYPLWVASYYVTKPYMPLPWTKYLFWQYTDKEDIGDTTYKYDCSYFNGTEAELRSYLGIVPSVVTIEDRVKLLEDKVNIIMGKLGL